MFRKIVFSALFLCAAAARAQEPGGPIPWRRDITMLVVPREPQPVRLALDIARYYPVLTVCYQTRQAADPVLHAWNGEGWVAVSAGEYTNGTFFTHPPQQAVLIESKETPAPDLLVPDGTWCRKGRRLSTTDERAMIHLLGRHFDFPYSTWMQFAKRYDYPLEAINPSLKNVYWWHYRGDNVLPAFKARDFEADTEHWQPLNITPPEPIEPVETAPPDEAAPPEKTQRQTVIIKPEPETEPAEDWMEDPAAPSTNDAATVEQIIEEMTEPSDAPEPKPDPFSTDDVPPAELIFLPAE